MGIVYLSVFFYLLMYMDLCMKKSEFDFSHSGLKLRHDIDELYKNYTKHFANIIYDYVVYACFREIRHAHDECSITPIRLCDFHPHYIYVCNVEELYREVEPNSFLRMCSHVFNNGYWPHSYGGKSWGQAADLALLYHKIPDVLFIDRIIDLQHNTGSMFSKENPLFVESDKRLNEFLTLKTEIIDEFELASYLIFESERRWNKQIKNLVFRFLTLYGSRHFDDPNKLGWGFETYDNLLEVVAKSNPDRIMERNLPKFLASKHNKYTCEYDTWPIITSEEYKRRYLS